MTNDQNKPGQPKAEAPAEHTQAELFQQLPDSAPDHLNPMAREMIRRFPYMFSPPAIELAVHAGWYPVFRELCVAIDALLGDDKHGFRWVQTKEKFGSAAWYWSMDNQSDLHVDVAGGDDLLRFVDEPDPGNDLRAKVCALVDEATARTTRLCIACGVPAQRLNHRGYLLVCCQPHHQMLRDDPQCFWQITNARKEGGHD